MRAGRFGPYVNHGKVNATLKGGMSPETITLEEAIRLIEDKDAAGTKTRAKKTKRAAPKPAAAKTKTAKSAAPKTAAKVAAARRKPAAKPPAQKSQKAKRA